LQPGTYDLYFPVAANYELKNGQLRAKLWNVSANANAVDVNGNVLIGTNSRALATVLGCAPTVTSIIVGRLFVPTATTYSIRAISTVASTAIPAMNISGEPELYFVGKIEKVL